MSTGNWEYVDMMDRIEEGEARLRETIDQGWGLKLIGTRTERATHFERINE
jgi:hypothetical protein